MKPFQVNSLKEEGYKLHLYFRLRNSYTQLYERNTKGCLYKFQMKFKILILSTLGGSNQGANQQLSIFAADKKKGLEFEVKKPQDSAELGKTPFFSGHVRFWSIVAGIHSGRIFSLY